MTDSANDMAADAEVIWDVLTDHARRRDTIEYGELRDLLGSKSFHPGAWSSRRLEHIQAYCWEQGLPPLTVLVVNKATQQPGDGYRGSTQDFFDDKQRVFAHVWSNSPSVDTLADCYTRHSEIYAIPFEYAEHIRDDLSDDDTSMLLGDSTDLDQKRIEELLFGIGAEAAAYEPFGAEYERELRELSILVRRGQPQFRRDLLAAYEGKCALSGCDVVEALEAAHIVPYSAGGRDDVTNGLLLRADLHTLMDSSKELVKLRVAERGEIEVVLSDSLTGHYGELVFRAPANPAHVPSTRAIHQRWASGD